MSRVRKIVEHALMDDGKKVQSSIYKSINEKVANILESKKIELAGGALVSEDHCGDMDKLKKKMKKTKKVMKVAKKKMKGLKEDIAILKEAFELTLSEDSSCDLDSDDVASELGKKKKKLKKMKKKAKKAKKKLKKLKESRNLLESGEDEIDENGEWSEDDEGSEEDTSEEEESN